MSDVQTRETQPTEIGVIKEESEVLESPVHQNGDLNVGDKDRDKVAPIRTTVTGGSRAGRNNATKRKFTIAEQAKRRGVIRRSIRGDLKIILIFFECNIAIIVLLFVIIIL